MTAGCVSWIRKTVELASVELIRSTGFRNWLSLHNDYWYVRYPFQIQYFLHLTLYKQHTTMGVVIILLRFRWSTSQYTPLYACLHPYWPAPSSNPPFCRLFGLQLPYSSSAHVSSSFPFSRSTGPSPSRGQYFDASSSPPASSSLEYPSGLRWQQCLHASPLRKVTIPFFPGSAWIWTHTILHRWV